MRAPDSNVLEFVAGTAVDADIYYLAAATGPGHESYDPDPGPPTRMFFYQRPTEAKWFYHDLPEWQVISTAFVPEQSDGRSRRVLALGFDGQLEDFARSGAKVEIIASIGRNEFYGGLTRLRLIGGDLFCCGVNGKIYHRSKGKWKRLRTDFPTGAREKREDNPGPNDFESWLGCVGHLFELDGVLALPEHAAEREAELRRRFEGWRSLQGHVLETRSLIEDAIGCDVASVNDLCGTGFKDLYAIGSDGLIAHWDGSAWSVPEQVTASELNHACNTDSGELVFVGTEATIITGRISTRFRSVPHQISTDIDFYCACQYGEVMCIGSESGLYTYRLGNGAVERVTTGLPEELMEAAIIDISVVGDVIWVLTPWDLARFDGTRWEVILHPDNG